MSYKVIQWGTGNVGKHALRALLDRPDIELVGLKVYSDEKVGKDAGEIVGYPPIGIKGIKDVDEILKIDADCVMYNALGMTLGDIEAPLNDICMLLSHGYDVISSAIEQAIYPPSLASTVRQRLEEACEKGQSSFLATGVNPGFAMDLWPIQMSRLSRKVEKIRAIEVCDMRAYGSPNIMAYMGFGKLPEEMGNRDARSDKPSSSPFHSSMMMVADAMRFKLTGFRSEHSYGITDKPVDVKVGRIEPGKIAVVRMRYVGESEGRDVLINEWVWRVTDEVHPEWGTGEYWAVEIEGDPHIKTRIDAETTFDSGRIVSITVATTAVNSIPVLCDSAPGLKSIMDLLPCGGGTLLPA